MRVHLKLPDLTETPVHLNLIPKTGERIDFAGGRYLVASVVHSVETAKTVLELAHVQADHGYRSLFWNEMTRYRTTDIRAYSPAVRPRISWATR